MRNQGDGWTYSVDFVTRLLDQHRAGQEPRRDGASSATDEPALDGYPVLARRLGERTAQLHLALATASTDNLAFAPEAIGAGEPAAWRAKVLAEVEQTLDRLAAAIETIPPAARASADRIVAARDRLAQALPAAAVPSGQKIRTHGDYHLGQVLIHNNDFLIIDFEGEPARSLDERRAKQSPLRDVAGMLRSFAYAGAAALDKVAAEGVERERIEPVAASWERVTREAFLDAYRRTVAGSALLPDFDAAAPLLRLFELEKAAYELRYELENRPSWAGIPLRGLEGLLGLLAIEAR
jgi:maltose alpha-D-glucosyltransferase/alpha-amylase